MTEPSANTFDITEYFHTNGSNFESVNSVGVQGNRGDLTTPPAIEGNGQRAEGFQYTVMATADPNFEGSGSDWSPVDNSRPISTPVVSTEPATVTTFGSVANVGFQNAAQGGGSSGYIGDGYTSNHGSIQFHRPEENFQVARYVRGNGLDFHRFPAAGMPTVGRTPLNFPSLPPPPPYQQNPMQYFQHHPPLPGNTAMIYQPSPWSCFPTAPGRVYQYQPPYNIPQPMMPQSSLHFIHGRPSVGSNVTPRPQILQRMLSTPPATQNQPKPKPSTTSKGNGDPAKFFLYCAQCNRGYQSSVSFHNHWLRVHVLQVVENGNKRRQEEMKTPAPKKQRLEEAASSVGSNVGTMGDVGETAAVPTTPSKPPSRSISMDSNPALDLSLKPSDPGLARTNNEETSSPAVLMHPQEQAVNFISLDGKSVQAAAKNNAEYLAIHSVTGAMSVILPPNAIQTVKVETPNIEPNTGIELSPSDNSDGKSEGSAEAGKEYRFTCTDCPKKYRSRRSLNKHVYVHHMPIKPKKSRSIYEDIAAMEQLPFACNLCPKHFETKKLLQQHIRFHGKAGKAADGKK